MGEYSFQCAKSDTSIPIPRATPRPQHHCAVHLYLPQGQRVSGEITGYGEIVVTGAFTRGPNGEERPINGDILDHAWLANAGGEILNIYGAVGLQIFEGTQSTDEVFNRILVSEDDNERLDAHVKVVKDSHYDPANRYENLPASARCPWQGRDFPSTRVFVKHAYEGNARQALHDLYDEAVALNCLYGVPGSDMTSLTLTEAHKKPIGTTLEFVMAYLRPEEAERLLNQETSLSELMDDPDWVADIHQRFPDRDVTHLLPDGCLNLEHADLALMVALSDPERRETLATFALVDDQPTGPSLG